MESPEVHPRFKFNRHSYSKRELGQLAYILIKEGKDFEKSIGNFLTDWLDGNTTIMVQTSGSTGKPKSIFLKKEQMVNSAMATGEFFDLKPGDKALLCLSADYIAGKMMLVRALVLGLELDCVAPSSRPMSGISKIYDFVAMVPLQLENSLEALSKIKTLIIGGAPMSYSLKVQVQAQVQAQDRVQTQKGIASVYETYGMTETITHVAVKKVNSGLPLRSATKFLQATEAESFNYAQDKLRRSFVALPHVRFSTDDRGCLIIDAPRVSDKPVVTNDLVRLISDTEFEWSGRYDNIVNSGGIKLIPEQIEAKLMPIIGNRFFMTGIPDERLGQKLVLLVEGEVDTENLFSKIKPLKTLQKFEVPKEIFQVPKFVETGNGKVSRGETVARLLNNPN